MSVLDQSEIAAQRNRLIKYADTYMHALGERALAEVRISPDAHLTENTSPLAMGTGLWRTIVGKEQGGQYFVDTRSGQVAYWGVINEISGPSLIGLRLNVRGQLVTDVETLVLRGSTSNYFSPEVITTDYPRMHEVIPHDERVSRQDLIDVADSYFDAIEQNDGALVSVSPDCRRIVNGITDSTMDAADLDITRKHLTLGISEQLDGGHYNYIERIRDRRYSIVDVERGLVHCQVVFDHPGDVTRPSGELPFGYPSSMLFFEVFKVRTGQLCDVWAIGSNALPYATTSGWQCIDKAAATELPA